MTNKPIYVIHPREESGISAEPRLVRAACRRQAENFLLGAFDHEDLFGKRKGIEHSPHIRAQLNLDSNLVYFYLLLTVIAFGMELKYHDEFVALRQNWVSSDMGKFKYDDFK